jgi:hypothetical protein
MPASRALVKGHAALRPTVIRVHRYIDTSYVSLSGKALVKEMQRDAVINTRPSIHHYVGLRAL